MGVAWVWVTLPDLGSQGWVQVSNIPNLFPTLGFCGVSCSSREFSGIIWVLTVRVLRVGSQLYAGHSIYSRHESHNHIPPKPSTGNLQVQFTGNTWQSTQEHQIWLEINSSDVLLPSCPIGFLISCQHVSRGINT